MRNFLFEKLALRASILNSDPDSSLTRILTHARDTVPYYRELFDANSIGSNTRVEANEISRIPPLEKQTIREHTSSLVANYSVNGSRYWNTSGGSTGEPLRFMQDSQYRKDTRTLLFHHKSWTGYRFGDPLVKLWGDEKEVLSGSRSPRSRVTNAIKNQTLLNSFEMSAGDMRAFIKTISNTRPKLLVAYAQSLYELCRFANEENLNIEGVAAVITSAGTLYPFMRELIESTLGIRIYNRYGSREVGIIAGECEQHQGMHLMDRGVLVEIVDEQGAAVEHGVEGEIVVTSLINYSMPLIRYRIGDRGTLSPSPCACGRSSLLLSEVSGRVVDLFQTEDGRKIDGEFFTHLLYFRDWVEKFQFVQQSVNLIQLKVVPRSDPPQRDLEEIQKQVLQVMGPTCELQIELCSSIPQRSTGKFRYTVSEVT